MDFNNIGKIKFKGEMAAASKKEVEHDNKYEGEKVTKNTPNPNELYGRVAVQINTNPIQDRIKINPPEQDVVRNPDTEKYMEIIDTLVDNNKESLPDDMWICEKQYSKYISDKQQLVGAMLIKDDFKVNSEQRNNMINYLSENIGMEKSKLEGLEDKELVETFSRDNITSEYDRFKFIFDGKNPIKKYDLTNEEYEQVYTKFDNYFKSFNSRELSFLLNSFNEKLYTKDELMKLDFNKLHERNLTDITGQLKMYDGDALIKNLLACDDKEFDKKIKTLNSRSYLIDNAKKLDGNLFNALLVCDDNVYDDAIKFYEKYKPSTSKNISYQFKLKDCLNAKISYETTHDNKFIQYPLTKEEFEAKKNKVMEYLKENYKIDNVYLNEENIFLAEQFKGDKFNKDQLTNMLHSYSKDAYDTQLKIDWFNKLLEDENIDSQSATDILVQMNSSSEDLIEALYNNPKYQNNKIKDALNVSSTIFDNKKLTPEIINARKEFVEFAQQNNENNNNNIGELSNILSEINEDNVDFAKTLWIDSDFPKNSISKSIDCYASNKINKLEVLKTREKFYNAVSKDKSIDMFARSQMLHVINESNCALLNELLEDNRIPKSELYSIGLFSSLKQDITDMTKMYHSLKSDENLSDVALAQIIKNTTKETAKYIERLYKDEDFPNDLISEAIDFRDSTEALELKLNIYDNILSKDKNMSNESKAKLMGQLENANKDLFLKMYNDNIIPRDKLERAITLYDTDPADTVARNERMYDKLINSPIKDEPEHIAEIIYQTNDDKEEYANNLIENYKDMGVRIKDIPLLLNRKDFITPEKLNNFRHAVGDERFDKFSRDDKIVGATFTTLLHRDNISEISINERKELLKNLMSFSADLFNISDELSKQMPLIPKNQEEYCKILPAIVRSVGVSTKPIESKEEIEEFNHNLTSLSDTLKDISDEDFANLKITQEYSKDDFTEAVLKKLGDLPKNERIKVCNHFGFELRENKGNGVSGYSIAGYPINNNESDASNITDPKTLAVIDELRSDVIKFSENNTVHCDNKQVEALLNDIVKVLPELHTCIEKAQHGNGKSYGHDFDIMQHSLKVMQKISQDPNFSKLNESDKKVMLLSSLMHDITKREGVVDGTHANEGSFDTLFICKKFNLTKDEERKLYTLCKHHEWLEFVNTAKTEEEQTKRLQSVAYDLRQDNMLEMSKIFTHADLKSVRKDDSFHDTTVGSSRKILSGEQRSFGESANVYAEKIERMIGDLKRTQPILPTTKIPKSNKIKEAITTVNQDGSTDIKGVYIDKNGLVVLKYNEIEDWEKIGFPKGSVSRGITANEYNTGNIKFIAHGLDYPNQLVKFDAFGLMDSDALLSVSYAERPESKYRFFRAQGVLLDVDTKDIHGGGDTDSGSGCGKSIQDFKNRYIFGGERESDRNFLSDRVKDATGMTTQEYIDFVKNNENKSFSEIEPAEYREQIIRNYATINSQSRSGDRSYNEMYVSNPSVEAVFAYDFNDYVGKTMDFIEREDKRLNFLKQFAIERDIPMVVFGD